MKSLIKKIISEILAFESRLILKKYHPLIIAITGSVGKTSTKDAIYTVLSSVPGSFVRKSEKSFNSEIGVPLTILGSQNGWGNPVLWLKNIIHGLDLILFKSKYPECLVLEVGADHPGDIQKVAKWLKPHIVVMTKVSAVPVHVEFFSSAEALFKEKVSLARALRKEGTLVLSGDDERIRTLAVGMPQARCLTFGIFNQSTITASHDSVFYEEIDGQRVPVGMAFKLNYEGNSLPVMIRGLMGIHHIYPLLAAAATGIARKMLLTDIVASFKSHVPPRGRMNILDGINSSVIIDDTYNSSPDALHEALKTLERIEVPGKKIAILGDMLELGKFSLDEHKKAGEYADKVADVVITVGQRAKVMSGKGKAFDTSYEAADYITKIVGKGDVVLVKGSQSIRMERIVKALLKNKEKAAELLVRQEPEWLAKK